MTGEKLKGYPARQAEQQTGFQAYEVLVPDTGHPGDYWLSGIPIVSLVLPLKLSIATDSFSIRQYSKNSFQRSAYCFTINKVQ